MMRRALFPLLLLCVLLGAGCSSEKEPFRAERTSWIRDEAWPAGLVETATYSLEHLERPELSPSVLTMAVRAVTYDTLHRVEASADAVPETRLPAFHMSWRTSAADPAGAGLVDVLGGAYLDRADMGTVQMTLSRQESTGATFKVLYREGNRAAVYTNSPRPGQGEKYKRFAFSKEGVPYDVLPLWLRSLSWEPGAVVEVAMINTLTDGGYRETLGTMGTVTVEEREVVQTPKGPVPCWRVKLAVSDVRETFWLAEQAERLLVARETWDKVRWTLTDLVRGPQTGR